MTQTAHVHVSLLDVEPVQNLLFAANDLLNAASESDDLSLVPAVAGFEAALDGFRRAGDAAMLEEEAQIAANWQRLEELAARKPTFRERVAAWISGL